MPDRYSEAEVEAMRGTRPHPLAHVIDPRIVQFNEERRRWLATFDAIKAERDAMKRIAQLANDALGNLIVATRGAAAERDAIKAERDRAVEALREIIKDAPTEDCCADNGHGSFGYESDDPSDYSEHGAERQHYRDAQIARTALARVGKGGA